MKPHQIIVALNNFNMGKHDLMIDSKWNCLVEASDKLKKKLSNLFYYFIFNYQLVYIPRFSTAPKQILTNRGTVVPSRSQRVDRWQPKTRSDTNIKNIT